MTEHPWYRIIIKRHNGNSNVIGMGDEYVKLAALLEQRGFYIAGAGTRDRRQPHLFEIWVKCTDPKQQTQLLLLTNGCSVSTYTSEEKDFVTQQWAY